MASNLAGEEEDLADGNGDEAERQGHQSDSRGATVEAFADTEEDDDDSEEIQEFGDDEGLTVMGNEDSQPFLDGMGTEIGNGIGLGGSGDGGGNPLEPFANGSGDGVIGGVGRNSDDAAAMDTGKVGHSFSQRR